MEARSGQYPVIISVPFTGGGSIVADGALVMPGVTADTDLGLAIKATTACADAVGVLKGASVVAQDSVVAGTIWTYKEVELFDSYRIIRVEYDQSDTMAVASNSGTTLTITSLEDNIDTSWIYAVSGTGAGELSFLTASASGSATQKTAMGWDSTTTCIKILRVFHQLAKINTAATKIGTDAAAGSWTVCVLQNWVEAKGLGLQLLNPTKHDNVTLSGAHFYADLLVRNTAGHTTE